MKILSILFMLSFIPYISAFMAIPYVTAQLWADILMLLFVLSCIYQIIYISKLRNKDSVSLTKSIMRYFLCLSFVALTIGFIIIGDTFINGYTPTAFLTGEVIGETVYGFEALKEDGFTTYVGSFFIITGIIIDVALTIITIYLKKLNKKCS